MTPEVNERAISPPSALKKPQRMAIGKPSLIFAAISAVYFVSYFTDILPGEDKSTERTLFPESGIGITTPLADCSPEAGCTELFDTYPALYVQLVSSRSLVVGLAADAVNPTDANHNIRLNGSHDARQLPIELVGHSRITVGFDRSEKPLNELRMHILLVEPLVSGRRYSLEIPIQGLQTLKFTYQREFISPSIQVNQVGYLPDEKKLAYAGNWLGTAGPMPLDDKHFSVSSLDNGRTLFQGELEKVNDGDAWSGNAVYRADFSEVQTQGEYYLSIPGLGNSAAFSVKSDVFKPVFHKVFRLFYHSRNSTAVSAPWADPGFERPGGIPEVLSAYIHPAVAASGFSSGEKAGSYKMVRRGWFDAGDYGQYVVNAAPVWYAFAAGIDLMPAVFSSDDFNLPESHNGIPDIIDELEWGMDWLLGMQNQDNGGVYSRLVPLRWDETRPQDVKTKRYLFEITSHATASFAAITALHSRLLRNLNPQRAELVLDASRTAWEFLENTPQWPAEGDVYKNPKGVHAGEYPDSSATDNRLWAAAELYRTTAEPDFKTAFIDLLREFKPDPTEGVTFRRQAMAAYWSMFQALQDNGKETETVSTESDLQLREQLAKVLTTAADWYLRKADEHPFNAPVHQHLPYTGWGSFAHSSRAIVPLLQAWTIDGDRKYCDRAAEMTNPQLGANPQSISYITGIGSRSPRFPLSLLSRYDTQVPPLNGIPVNGPHHHLPALWPSTRAVNDAYIPHATSNNESAGSHDSYPPLRRYVDSYLLPPMSEPTIAEYAITAVAYGLLSDGSLPCSNDR